MVTRGAQQAERGSTVTRNFQGFQRTPDAAQRMVPDPRVSRRVPVEITTRLRQLPEMPDRVRPQQALRLHLRRRGPVQLQRVLPLQFLHAAKNPLRSFRMPRRTVRRTARVSDDRHGPASNQNAARPTKFFGSPGMKRRRASRRCPQGGHPIGRLRVSETGWAPLIGARRSKRLPRGSSPSSPSPTARQDPRDLLATGPEPRPPDGWPAIRASPTCL